MVVNNDCGVKDAQLMYLVVYSAPVAVSGILSQSYECGARLELFIPGTRR